MPIKIKEVRADMLSQYAEIPIAFEVTSVLQIDLINDGLGGIKLREEKVERPYIKDYDACEDSERPKRWPKRFDVSNWGFFIASDENQHVGGAVVAFNTSGVHMLAGRKDLSVLWDIRVHPDFRRSGIGTELFNHAASWSKKRGCRQLKIETQNVNVPACRFYAKQGCRLGEINRYAYAGHPKVGHEVMLIWYLDL
jgi:ribosomal protein S18 acetylase RimI-like enzyme